MDGWPKHVENTLVALGHELMATEGKLSAVDVPAVKDRATQYRVDYYNSRFGSFKAKPRIIGEIMAEMGPKPRSGGETSVIVNRKRRESKWLEEFTATELEKLDFSFLHRYGLIDIIPNLPVPLFQCPIPPLHTLAYSNDIESFGKMLDLGHDINGKDA